MELILKAIADYGVALASFIVLIYFFFNDKKTTNENIKMQIENQKETNKVLDQISMTLVQLSERVAKLESKRKVKDDE